jgi:uncharacterized repeat protein (TIGR04076 family)
MDFKTLQLPLDLTNLTDADYKALWKLAGPIELKMVEKVGKCKHAVGNTFYYTSPYEKPQGVCYALLHVLELYTWRVVFGFPSWEADDRAVYRIHCPSKKGTVWELRKVVVNNKENV